MIRIFRRETEGRMRRIRMLRFAINIDMAEWYEQIVDKEKERHYTGLGDLQSATSISLGAEENKNKNEKKSSRHGVFLVGHPTKS